MPRLVVMAVAALVVASAPAAVWAQTPRATLEYRVGAGAERCPDEAELRELVMSRMGHDPFADGAGAAEHSVPRVTVDIASQQGRLAATVRVAEGEAVVGERVLGPFARGCTELAEALAVALVVALESLAEPPAPIAVVQQAETAPSRAPAVPAEPREVSSDRAAAAPASAPAPAPAPARPAATPRAASDTTLDAELSARAGVTFGWQPAPTALVALRAGLHVGRFAAGVEVRTHTNASVNGASGTATTQWIAGALVVCGVIEPLRACALGVAGRLEGWGDASRRGDLFVIALGVELALVHRVAHWLALAARAELAAPLGRPRVVLDGDVLWTGPVAVGALTAGVELIFP